jgi:hypothetical protein
MEATLSTRTAGPEDAAIACPVCGRPARATVLQRLIAQVFCRRCDAVWRISPDCR